MMTIDVGVYKISGADLYGGDVIPAGSEIVCDYEISDGGALSMSASSASLGTEFARKNFYFHDEAKLDLEDTGRLADEGREIIGRVDEMSGQIDDPRLDLARQKAENAAGIDSLIAPDEESVQEAYNDLYEARKILSGIRKDHAREVNLMDLEDCTEYFAQHAAEYATQSESAAFNNLARTARRYASDSGFSRYLNELWRKIHSILYRQDWFVVGLFRDMAGNPGDYSDKGKFTALKARGMKCADDGDIEGLRVVISELAGLMKGASSDENRLRVNIIRA